MMKNERIFHWDLIQGSDEWLELRAGLMTGSVVKTFLVNGKSENGFGAGAMTQLYKCLEERMSGIPRQSFSTKATEWGHDFEPLAITEFERRNFMTVKPCGFVTFGSVGASPDGLVPDLRIGVEAKNLPTKHVQILETNVADDAHVQQCLFNLWVTGYDEWRLVYYHPNLPSSANYVEFVIKPDPIKFKIFDDRAFIFEQMIEKRLKKYQI